MWKENQHYAATSGNWMGTQTFSNCMTLFYVKKYSNFVILEIGKIKAMETKEIAWCDINMTDTPYLN